MKQPRIIVLLAATLLSANGYAADYDFNAACDFQDRYLLHHALSKQLSAKEWADIKQSKGKKSYSEWLGEHYVYSTRDMKVVYTDKREDGTPLPHIWQVTIDNPRLPKNMRSREGIKQLLNISDIPEVGQETYACDCSDMRVTYQQDSVTNIIMNAAACD